MKGKETVPGPGRAGQTGRRPVSRALGEEQQRAKLRKGPVARGLAAEVLHAVGLS